MKKTLIITFINLLFISFTLQAQPGKKSSLNEYRYFGIKFGIVHNYTKPAQNNNSILIASPTGDMMQGKRKIGTYTPGGNFELIYNFDFKNDVAGIVIGANVGNFGYSNTYLSDTLSYKVVEQIRVINVGIPIHVKFWLSNIYKNQSYITIGLQYNFRFKPMTYQTASFGKQKLYIGEINKAALKSSGLGMTLGFNYNVYFIKIHYNFKSFINKNYAVNIEEGVVKPYENINATNALYITTGVNIPLTRWLTARNWAAEKTRRFFKKSN